MRLHLICGFMAGFVATIVSSPFDVVKTRLMSSPDAYKGVVNCFSRTLKEEGPLAFYKGFIPNVTRIGSWACICFVSMEQIKLLLIGPKEII